MRLRADPGRANHAAGAAVRASAGRAPLPCERIVAIEVSKRERQLRAHCDGGGMAEMPVALGRESEGPKREAGDWRTPELGGHLGFHGEGKRWRGDSRLLDWTYGCFGLADADVDFLAERSAVGTPVSIEPRAVLGRVDAALLRPRGGRGRDRLPRLRGGALRVRIDPVDRRRHRHELT